MPGMTGDMCCDFCECGLGLNTPWINWELHEVSPDVWKVVCEPCVMALELYEGK